MGAAVLAVEQVGVDQEGGGRQGQEEDLVGESKELPGLALNREIAAFSDEALVYQSGDVFLHCGGREVETVRHRFHADHLSFSVMSLPVAEVGEDYEFLRSELVLPHLIGDGEPMVPRVTARPADHGCVLSH